MPYINVDGKLVEVTQEQFDIYTIGQNQSQVGTVQNPATAPNDVASGGTVTVTPTGTAQILTPSTTNNTPGQTLTTSYQQVTTSATDTNYGATIQTFDDGSKIQTFDDGSVLATGTDGSITSAPAPTVDYTVNVQDSARAGLTADQLALLGAADATDPFIRARLDLPPLSDVQTLSGAIGNINFGNIGNVVSTAFTDIKDAAGSVGNAISDLFSSGTPNAVPTSSVTTAPETSNAGTTTQVFDDGSKIQTFDDGSVLATGTDGSLTATDAPVDNTQGYGQITDSGNVSASSVDTSPAPTNYGASIQTFDDGTTLQTFDDGSVLATGTDGSITSAPAPTNAGTTTQIFDDGSVLTTNADGSVSATNAIEGSNVATSSSDVQAKAREGLTSEQLTALGGADATDPYIRDRLDLPPLTTQPNLVDALTSNTPEPTTSTVSASDVNTAPADTNAGTSTQTFDDGTTLQTFDDGSVLATGTDGSVTSSPAPTDAGTTTTVDETTGAVTTTSEDGSVATENLPASADATEPTPIDIGTTTTVDETTGAVTTTSEDGTTVTTTVPEDVIATAPPDISPTVDPEVPAPVDTPVPDTQVTYDAAPTDAGTTTTILADGTTVDTSADGAVAITDLPPTEVVYDAGTVNSEVDPQASLAPGESIVPPDQVSTDAPVDNTDGYGQITDAGGTDGGNITDAPADTNFGTTTQTFDDGTTLQTFDDGSVLATGTDGSITSTDAPVDNTDGYGQITDGGNADVAATDVNTSASTADDPYAAQDAENGANAGTGTTDTGTGGEGAGSNSDSAAASANIQGLVKGAQQQQTIANQRKQINNGDWRVRLRLAPQSKYLYNASNPGILAPLKVTDGIIFPYTPAINTSYRANYSNYDLTHSNYRGYFYQNSYVDAVNLTATFTAQDTNDANYLLAVIHFLRSATKMFYGQDAQRGSPPPVVYLTGLGDYQFREHSCLISQFTYNLPADVDYIRAGSPNNAGLNFNNIRDRQSVATNSIFDSVNRLAAAFLPKGGVTGAAAPPTLGLNRPTYVPTKMEIQLTLLPIQSRQQVSKQFSVKEFANGNLLKGGFW